MCNKTRHISCFFFSPFYIFPSLVFVKSWLSNEMSCRQQNSIVVALCAQNYSFLLKGIARTHTHTRTGVCCGTACRNLLGEKCSRALSILSFGFVFFIGVGGRELRAWKQKRAGSGRTTYSFRYCVFLYRFTGQVALLAKGESSLVSCFTKGREGNRVKERMTFDLFFLAQVICPFCYCEHKQQSVVQWFPFGSYVWVVFGSDNTRRFCIWNIYQKVLWERSLIPCNPFPHVFLWGKAVPFDQVPSFFAPPFRLLNFLDRIL